MGWVLRIKNLIIMGPHWKIQFLGQGMGVSWEKIQ